MISSSDTSSSLVLISDTLIRNDSRSRRAEAVRVKIIYCAGTGQVMVLSSAELTQTESMSL